MPQDFVIDVMQYRRIDNNELVAVRPLLFMEKLNGVTNLVDN